MMDLNVARRYSRALLEFAGKSVDLDALEKNFIHLITLLDQHPEITHLVLNSTISQAEKEDFVDKVFASDITRVLIQFIKVLIKKRRFQEVRLIQEEFHKLYEKKRGLQEVRVITASPLSQSSEKKLSAVLKTKLRSEIRLIPETDPSILGGLILRFNGTEIDASYKNRLAELRQKLMA